MYYGRDLPFGHSHIHKVYTCWNWVARKDTFKGRLNFQSKHTYLISEAPLCSILKPHILKPVLEHIPLCDYIEVTIEEGAQWLSGRVLDSRPKCRWCEPHRRHCVVSFSKTHIS